jgi:hypothetical protein
MAGFGFNTDTNNLAMDFGAGAMNMAFAFEQPAAHHPQSFSKADEDNTSNPFFFADDEGIDTSSSQFDPLFTMPSAESSFTMPQTLVSSSF